MPSSAETIIIQAGESADQLMPKPDSRFAKFCSWLNGFLPFVIGGGLPCVILFWLGLVGGFAFLIALIATQAPEWMTPKITVTYQSPINISIPDMYVCFPGGTIGNADFFSNYAYDPVFLSSDQFGVTKAGNYTYLYDGKDISAENNELQDSGTKSSGAVSWRGAVNPHAQQYQALITGTTQINHTWYSDYNVLCTGAAMRSLIGASLSGESEDKICPVDYVETSFNPSWYGPYLGKDGMENFPVVIPTADFKNPMVLDATSKLLDNKTNAATNGSQGFAYDLARLLSGRQHKKKHPDRRRLSDDVSGGGEGEGEGEDASPSPPPPVDWGDISDYWGDNSTGGADDDSANYFDDDAGGPTYEGISYEDSASSNVPENVPAFCTRFAMKPTAVSNSRKASRHAKTRAVLMTTIDWCSQDTTGPGTKFCDFNTAEPEFMRGTFLQVYLSAQGESPIGKDANGNEVVTASAFTIAADGSQNVYGLKVEVLQDYVNSDGKKQTKYKQDSLAYVGKQSPPSDPTAFTKSYLIPTHTKFGFLITSHEVRHTVIANWSFSAILSAIGGLLAIAGGIVWKFFKSPPPNGGYIDPSTGKHVVEFKYLLGPLKKYRWDYIKTESWAPNDKAAEIDYENSQLEPEPKKKANMTWMVGSAKKVGSSKEKDSTVKT